MDIEQRIERIESRQEIEDLVVRYFIASDGNDFEGIEQCFTADAEFCGTGFPLSRGREKIMAFMQTFRASVTQSVHTPDYTLIEFDPSDPCRATGTVGAHIELGYGDTTVIGAFRYHDEYFRNAGTWKLKRRELLTIHVGPWDQIGNSLTEELNVRWPGSERIKSDFARD